MSQRGVFAGVIAALVAGCSSREVAEPADSAVDSASPDTTSDVSVETDAGECPIPSASDVSAASPSVLPARCTAQSCREYRWDATCNASTGRCELPSCTEGFCPCRSQFVGDCAEGFRCYQGKCFKPVSATPVGGSCGDSTHCALGLTCVDGACAIANCGVAPGAPTCPDGTVCLRGDDGAGSCRPLCHWGAKCAACAPDEKCERLDGKSSVGGYLGWCRRAGAGPLPGAGASCSGICRAGYSCIDRVCLPNCDAWSACAGGQLCIARDGDVCRTACDPWGPDTCSAPLGCRPVTIGDAIAGACRTSLDCGEGCGIGSVCGGAGHCRPLCDPRVGSSHGCTNGVPCRAIAFEAYGYCIDGCDPWQPVGAQGCASGSWCRPSARSTATGRLLGECIASGSVGEGGSCYCEGYTCLTCAAGLVCSWETTTTCRRICDPESAKTGDGACPTGQTCFAYPQGGGECR